MSTNYYLACEQCRKKFFMANASAGGFAIYLDSKRKEKFDEFLSDHFPHKVIFDNENVVEDYVQVYED